MTGLPHRRERNARSRCAATRTSRSKRIISDWSTLSVAELVVLVIFVGESLGHDQSLGRRLSDVFVVGIGELAENLHRFLRVLKVEWVYSVERRRLGALLSTLPDQRWAEVRAAMLYAFGLDRR